MKTLNIVVFAIIASFVVNAEVISLTVDNFDEVVTGGKAVFVKFFAPWCGHCKRLAPDYEEMSNGFKDSKKVVVAEIDCDANRDICSRYQVTGYPTLMFFPKGSVTPIPYQGGRTIDDMTAFISEQAGTIMKKQKTAVLNLDDKNFDKIVHDKEKNVMVKFFAPWCGHCKALAPVYEELAKIYKNDDSLVLAEVDCDKAEHQDLCQKYEIQGFPTIKFFSKENKDGEDYSSGRDMASFIKFFNEKTGIERNEDGSLSNKAGRISELDELAKTFIAATEEAKKETLEKVKAKEAKGYERIMKLIVEGGEEAMNKEKARLEKLLSNKSIAAKKRDEFQIIRNVIDAFAQ